MMEVPLVSESNALLTLIRRALMGAAFRFTRDVGHGRIHAGWLLAAVVADPCQGHRLIAARADLADPSILHAWAGIHRGSSTDADASLACAKSSHLFFCRQLRRTQNDAVPPLEVAAVGVVPQSGLRSR
jgi:hypothetical protein